VNTECDHLNHGKAGGNHHRHRRHHHQHVKAATGRLSFRGRGWRGSRRVGCRKGRHGSRSRHGHGNVCASEWSNACKIQPSAGHSHAVLVHCLAQGRRGSRSRSHTGQCRRLNGTEQRRETFEAKQSRRRSSQEAAGPTVRHLLARSLAPAVVGQRFCSCAFCPFRSCPINVLLHCTATPAPTLLSAHAPRSTRIPHT
jgi:hypothetical protein